MNEILIIFAQLGEAEATIKRTKASIVGEQTIHVWTEGDVPCCYRFDRGWIVISNVGLHYAQMAVAKYAHLCDEVWNLGFAGSLRGELPVTEIREIEKVGKYLPLEENELDPRSHACVTFTLPHFPLKPTGSRLISSDFPIHDLTHRERLGKAWDLVDMEGYGVAFAAHALGKQCRIWKIISDFASPGGRELIRKHKGELSERIADTILGALPA
jgi:adenosylhomocysteine nucleosidase